MARGKALRLAAFAIVLALPVSAVAAKLTEKNSVSPKYVIRQDIGFHGIGCNVPARTSVPLLPGAFAVQVRAPKVGDRKGDLRITAIAVGAKAVTFTAVADSANICAPGDPTTTPPAERDWSETFKADIGLSLQLRTRYRLDLNVRQTKTALAPRKIVIKYFGSVGRIKWKSFGGRKAVGIGRLKFPRRDRCNPKKCPGHNGRFRVTLSTPSFCADLPDGKIQYGSMTWRPLRRMGRIRAGGVYVRKKGDCVLSKLRPVPR